MTPDLGITTEAEPMRTNANALPSNPATALAFVPSYNLGSGGDPEDEPRKPPRSDRGAAAREDLPYRVELWNEGKESVELVLAVTANGSIGYAAYYAATREYPQRYVTLRHKSRTVARWNGPEH
jgi:hypothetical protein